MKADQLFDENDATPGHEDDHGFFRQFVAQYDAPAYVRRARQVEGAFVELLARCQRQREEWLRLARLRLGMLRGLAGEWHALRGLVTDDEQLVGLERLHATLAPQLRIRVQPTSSVRTLRRALRELIDSIERFNRRWSAFLPTVELAGVNALRDGYNRYYLLEKECAMRSPRAARQGFCRLEPLTVEELTQLLPVLPVPRMQG